MLSPKNRAYLKSLANSLKPSLIIGKGEIDDTLLKSIDNALVAHELIKIKILPNSELEPIELFDIIATKTKSEKVSKIGRILTLYRRNEKNPRITLLEK